MELTMKESPYLIEPSERIKEAIRLAIKKNLFERFDIDKRLVNDYINSKNNLPIWIMEVVCKINLEDIKIPAQYQYLWFCLHNTTLTRTQPSGRVFRTKVNFSSCYVELNDDIKGYLKKACEVMNLPLYKFTTLCGYKKALANNKKTIPLLVILKICQILDKDVWDLLEGHICFGKNRREGKITLPKKEEDAELIW